MRGAVRSAGALGPLQALPAVAQLVLLLPELPKWLEPGGGLEDRDPRRCQPRAPVTGLLGAVIDTAHADPAEPSLRLLPIFLADK